MKPKKPAGKTEKKEPSKLTGRSFDGNKMLEPLPPKAPCGLEDYAFLRLRQLIGDPHSNPVLLPVIPVSKTTLWEWVRTGKFPRPYELGDGTSAWALREVRAWIESRPKTAAQSG